MHAAARLKLDGAHLQLQRADLLREPLHIGMHATGAAALRNQYKPARLLLDTTSSCAASSYAGIRTGRSKPVTFHSRACELATLQLRADQVSTHWAFKRWHMRRALEACTHAEL